MSVEFDVTELLELAADLNKAAGETLAHVRPVVQKGALNIKQDWQSRWRGLGSAPHLADAVTYDTKFSGASVEVEIGPDKGRTQGALGNIIEFGTVNNAPRPGGGPALKAEEPKFVKAIGDMLEDLIGGAR